MAGVQVDLPLRLHFHLALDQLLLKLFKKIFKLPCVNSFFEVGVIAVLYLIVGAALHLL